MSFDAATWIAQELSLTCLEEGEEGLRAISGALPPDVRELEAAVAQLAEIRHDDAALLELLDRARQGERGVLEVAQGRLIAWNAGPDRARVLFAPTDAVTRRRAAAADRAAGVTHEVANALTAIAGWARMAAAGGPLPERTRHALEIVQRSARDALGATRELLSAMRETGRSTVPPSAKEASSVSGIVGEVLETLRPQLDEAGIRLETDLASDVLGRVRRPALQLVVRNLVQNALDALTGGGCIRVTLREEGGEARLTVADDGPGMSDATLAQAFDRYFTTKERGTGLGLALVAQTVHEVGGRLETESRLGEGTRFDVWLPLAEAPVAPSTLPPMSSGVHPRPALVDEPVLVVDDDEAMRALVRTTLELQGARVHTAAGIEEALAHEGPFALVLIDLALGGERGDALLARLRAEGRVERSILITGSPDAELDPCGAPDAVLRKPFELEELARAIDAVIDARVLEAEEG